jgi:hypothetical protein
VGNEESGFTQREVCTSPWLIGVSFTAVLAMLRGGGGSSPILIALLRPGLFMAEWMGYASHDWQASLVMVFANSILYGACIFLIMWLVRRP